MKYFLLLIFTLVLAPLLAHEFWLDPEHFIVKKGDKINVRFYVGEDFNGENWGGNKERINYLAIYTSLDKDKAHGHIINVADKISDKKGDSLQFIIPDEGTHTIVYSSKNSYIQLDAKKFNAYLKEDGLLDALQYRTNNNELDSLGTEFYQRSVKTIIQVGNIRSNIDDLATGLPLEIVPATNPYNLNNNDSLKVVIYFRHEVYPNKLVNVWHRVKNKTIQTQMTTNDKGEIKFPITLNGKWMVSTVNMERNEGNSKARWQSYWASCTWGYY